MLVRFHARAVLAWGMVVQAAGLAAIALCIWQGAAVLVTFAAAVVAATAMVTSRPAISALLPVLTPTRGASPARTCCSAGSTVRQHWSAPQRPRVCLLVADFPVAFLAFAVIAGFAALLAFRLAPRRGSRVYWRTTSRSNSSARYA